MARNIVYNYLSLIFVGVFGLLTTSYIVKIINTELFGKIAIVQATIALIGGFFKFNSPKVMISILGKLKKSNNMIEYNSNLRIAVFCDYAGVLIGLLFSLVTVYLFDLVKFDIIFILLALSYCFDSLNLTRDVVIISNENYKRIFHINLIYSISKFSLIYLIYFYKDFISIFYYSILVCLTLSICSFVRYLHYHSFFVTDNKIYLPYFEIKNYFFNARKNLKNSCSSEYVRRNIDTYFDNLFRVIFRNLDIVLLGRVLGNSDVGLYKASKSLVEIIDSPLQLSHNYVFNQFCISPESKKRYRFGLFINVLIAFLICFLAQFFCNEIILNVYGINFYDVNLLFPVMIWSLFIYSSFTFSSNNLFLSNRVIYLSLGLVVSNVFFSFFVLNINLTNLTTLGWIFLASQFIQNFIPFIFGKINLKFRQF